MIDKIKELENKIKATTQTQEKIDLLNILADELTSIDLQRAITIAEEAKKLSSEDEFKDYPYKKGLAEALFNLGALNLKLFNYEHSLSNFHKALSLFQKLGNVDKQSFTLNNIGLIHFMLGNYSSALEFYLEALKYSNKLKNIAGLNNNVGMIYGVLENYEKALECFLKSLKIAYEINSIDNIISSLMNCCTTYLCLDKYSSALEYGFKCLEVCKDNNNIRNETKIYSTLGSVYKNMQNYPEALKYLNKSLEMSQKNENKDLELLSLMNIGDIYLEEKEYKKALIYLHKSFPIAEFFESEEELYTCHNLLAKTYKALENFKQSLIHYEKFLLIKDELYKKSSDNQLKNLQTIHEIENAKKESEIYHFKNVELKKINAELKKSKAQYKAVFEGANDGIIAIDIETKQILFSNTQMSELLDYTNEEFKELNINDIYPKKRLASILKQFDSKTYEADLLNLFQILANLKNKPQHVQDTRTLRHCSRD